MKEIAQQFEMDLEALKGVLHLDIRFEKLYVYPILFKRLLNNIISNSIKYGSDKNPDINIPCIDDGDKVIFTVADNGIGIPADQFENVFKIFNTINPNKESNGIGLSVCKKIVELHGGKIWIKSALGKGTAIKFTIPKK
ncbi:MAG: ATP-binding protein [Ferruginibacter sp.]